jgi:3-dehydroquinate synthetase
VIGTGEAAKSLATIETLTRGFARQGLTRRDVVVGVGGGMVTDVAGFAAAVYHRGTPVVHVSTTLLGMVDAAIGGKTGVNLPEGKNLVGAFWQPSGVICDLEVLASRCPPRETRCGLGEMAKYHFLTGDDLLDDAARPAHRALRRDQGRGRRVRRARGRPPGAAQLRPHAGPRRSRPRPATTSPTARRSPSG